MTGGLVKGDVDLQTSTMLAHNRISVYIYPRACTYKLSLHCYDLFSTSYLRVITGFYMMRTTRFWIYSWWQTTNQYNGKKKKSLANVQLTTEWQMIQIIYNKYEKKQILIDIGEIFSTAVKCLDVFSEKLKLVFALMWTFHFRRGVFFFLWMNEGIHKLSQQIELDHFWRFTAAGCLECIYFLSFCKRFMIHHIYFIYYILEHILKKTIHLYWL